MSCRQNPQKRVFVLYKNIVLQLFCYKYYIQVDDNRKQFFSVIKLNHILSNICCSTILNMSKPSNIIYIFVISF